MATRFEVPQFIDIQDKIFGPFTLQQFLFMAGGGGLGYIIYRSVPTFFKYPLALLALGFGLALAFYKINGRPFPLVFQSFIAYLFSPRLYLWRQRFEKPEQPKDADTKVLGKNGKNKKEKNIDSVEQVVSQPVTVNRLRDLAWNLDILESEKPRGTSSGGEASSTSQSLKFPPQAVR